MRRIFAWFTVGWLTGSVAFGCVGGCPSTSKSVRPGIQHIKRIDSTTVVPQPGPRHVEWDHYHVGGLVLVNPAVKDSAGGAQWMRLPTGTVMLFPRWVDGPAPVPPGRDA